jgi:hypothetical protein
VGGLEFKPQYHSSKKIEEEYPQEGLRNVTGLVLLN